MSPIPSVGCAKTHTLRLRRERWGSTVYDPVTDLYWAFADGPFKGDQRQFDLGVISEVISGSAVGVRRLQGDEIARLSTTSPLSFLWSPTQICNIGCKYCFADDGIFSKYRPTADEFARALDVVRELKVPRLDFSGGEPFLRRDLLQLVARASETVVPVVTTNGMLVRAEHARELSHYCSIVQVSLDSADERTNDSVRGSGSYKGALAAIKHFRDAGLRVRVFTVVHRANADELHHLLFLLQREGVVECKFIKCMPSRTGKSDVALAISSERFEAAVKDGVERLRQGTETAKLTVRTLDYDRDGGGCVILEEDGAVYQMGPSRMRRVGIWRDALDLSSFDYYHYRQHLHYYVGVHSGWQFYGWEGRADD